MGKVVVMVLRQKKHGAKEVMENWLISTIVLNI